MHRKKDALGIGGDGWVVTDGLNSVGVAVGEKALAREEQLSRAAAARRADASSEIVAAQDAGLQLQRASLVTQKPEVQRAHQHLP